MITEMKRVIEPEIDEEKPFFENLHRAMDALLEFRSEHELLIKLSQEVRDFGTPKAREGLEQIENAILEYLERHLSRSAGRKEIRPFDPKLVAFVVFKLYIALTSDWNKNNKPLSKEQIKEFIRDFLAGGLLLPPEV
ncbi:hypothetical protein HMSSN139_44070 [Paenibacillus sp. HMSSN-139]|nr:hypothetical protein HMSSN139_44070 [Paenibacillus sp. HMSSN-139]